jgi:hypothetical protein
MPVSSTQSTSLVKSLHNSVRNLTPQTIFAIIFKTLRFNSCDRKRAGFYRAFSSGAERNTNNSLLVIDNKQINKQLVCVSSTAGAQSNQLMCLGDSNSQVKSNPRGLVTVNFILVGGVEKKSISQCYEDGIREWEELVFGASDSLDYGVDYSSRAGARVFCGDLVL